MKAKKITEKEKIKIVRDCLATGLSYKETAKKYQVSYNNVYSWVQKYRKLGPEGLVDRRGCKRPNTVQRKGKKGEAENAILRSRNEYLEMENAALKKLDEIERGLISNRQGLKRKTKQSRDYKKEDLK